MTESDPRVRQGSLMVLERHDPVAGVVRGYYVMTRMVVGAMVVRVIRAAVVVIVIMLLRRLPLIVFLVFHPSILEPNFYLSLS